MPVSGTTRVRSGATAYSSHSWPRMNSEDETKSAVRSSQAGICDSISLDRARATNVQKKRQWRSWNVVTSGAPADRRQLTVRPRAST